MKKAMVLSVGMPRAGSGWFYNLTHDLVVAAGGADARETRRRYHLQKILTEVNCNMGTLTFYRLIPVMLPLVFEDSYTIKLHAKRKPLAGLFMKMGLIKPTYIYRDPRDALLSAYEYGQRMRDQGKTNAFTPLTSIEQAIEFMELYVQVGRGWLSLDSAFHIQYEELLQDYEEKVEELIRYLGLEDKRSAFDEVIDRYRPEQGSPDQQGTHFVKGKIGRHREIFSEREKAICERKFGAFLRDGDYEI